MRYSSGHTLRLIGGRLALDFVNTADWSADGDIVIEHLAIPQDLVLWRDALAIQDASIEPDLLALREFRQELRQLLLGLGDRNILSAMRRIQFNNQPTSQPLHTGQTLKAIVAVSAFAILSDQREGSRLKMCPGHNCGWLFIDETKNARRTWCLMEACGNRAKASRHYAKTKSAKSRA